MAQYYYLRADNHADMDAALTGSGLANIDDTGAVWPLIAGVDIYVIGQWSNVDESTDPPTVTPVPGYHVNIASVNPLPDTMLAHLPVIEAPATPWFVWAI